MKVVTYIHYNAVLSDKFMLLKIFEGVSCSSYNITDETKTLFLNVIHLI